VPTQGMSEDEMSAIAVDNVRRSGRSDALRWTARIATLTIGVLLALAALVTFLRVLLSHYDDVAARNLMTALAGFVPLLLATVAWRWHLAGGSLVVFPGTVFVSYCIVRLPYESVVFYYLVWPSAMVFLAGGVLHLVVAERDRQRYVSSKGSVLSWTARLLSFGAGILAVWWALQFCLYALDRHSGRSASEAYLAAVFFGLVPMLLVAVAWRWRLAGGIAMLGYAPVLFLGAAVIGLASEGHTDVSQLFFSTLLFLVGAVLHLTQRWCENRSRSCRKPQSSRPGGGISIPGCP
jgi:hypothetical protein